MKPVLLTAIALLLGTLYITSSGVALAQTDKGVTVEPLSAKPGDIITVTGVTELGLGDRLRFLPEKLSGGEKQRVAIARALVNDPALILADEPTANLDSKIGREIMRLLQRIAREQRRSVVIVSHDQRIKAIADRVLWLEDGQFKALVEMATDPVCGMAVGGYNRWRQRRPRPSGWSPRARLCHCSTRCSVYRPKMGESVAPSAPAVHVADLAAWQIQTTDLTELDVVRIRTGSPVSMTFDALPDLELPSKESNHGPATHAQTPDQAGAVA